MIWRAGGLTLGGGAALLALAVALGALPTPDLATALSRAADSLGGWTYVVVPALAFLETGAFVGLVVPGETAIVAGGAIAERGEVGLPALIALVWMAAVGGDVVSFLLGRRFGRSFIESHGARLRVGRDHVERTERFVRRHGGKAVLIGRFVGVLRALTPFLVGASGFPFRRFVPYSAIGALAWAAGLTLVGYGFSQSFAAAGEDATRLALIAALVVASTLVLGARFRRYPRWRRLAGARDGAPSQ